MLNRKLDSTYSFLKVLPESDELKKFIDHFYSIEIRLEGNFIPNAGEIDAVVFQPSGTPEILFNNSNGSILFHPNNSSIEFQSGTSILIGQLTKKINVTYPSHVRVFGIRFKPYGLFSFIDEKAMNLIKNMVAPVKTVLNGFDLKTAKLFSASQKLDSFASSISKIFLEYIIPEKKISEKLMESIDEWMVIENISTNISVLAERLGCTRQYFFQLFKKATGLNPKTFQKIIRITAFRTAMDRGDSNDPLSLMLLLGYFDQSHFCNDFKSIIGIKPSLYYKNDLRIVFE